MKNTEALRLAKWIENLAKEYEIGVLGLITAYGYAFDRFQDETQARNYVEIDWIPSRLGYRV